MRRPLSRDPFPQVDLVLLVPAKFGHLQKSPVSLRKTTLLGTCTQSLSVPEAEFHLWPCSHLGSTVCFSHTWLSKVVLLMAIQAGSSAGGRGTPFRCPPTQRSGAKSAAAMDRAAPPPSLLQPVRAGQGPANRRKTTLDEAESLTPDNEDDWYTSEERKPYGP